MNSYTHISYLIRSTISIPPSPRQFIQLPPATRGISTLFASWRPVHPSSITALFPRNERKYSSGKPSSKRWVARQIRDPFTKAAKVQGMKSRSGLKLLELNHTCQFFKPGMTVIDLGFAPGSWTEIAVACTHPGGRVVGVDILPAIPPRGASTFQGNFLDEKVQLSLRRYLSAEDRGRPRQFLGPHGYFEAERADDKEGEEHSKGIGNLKVGKDTVDVIISDMCEPWDLISGHWVNSIKTVHTRLMNVSGLRSRDHIHSMDLCVSALLFCVDVLKPSGDFVCKYYSGAHDKELEKGVKLAFTKTHITKPPASRQESRECYIVGKGFRKGLDKNALLAVMPHLQ